MGFFGRRQQRQPARPPEYIGRKFHSDAGVESSLTNFRTALSQQMGSEPVVTPARWTGPDPAPEQVVAARTAQGTAYLALWADGAMHFVAPDYHRTPTPPLVGMWKMRDNSLRSTGSVQADEFGVG
ncbi:hypothetical protein [Streptomyces sp. NPDC057694]|uniref:hypothetical protein n=1 Tax=Streptomyces sp. NPDC057694 TaxID=3346216 RepID=UPI0036A76159